MVGGGENHHGIKIRGDGLGLAGMKGVEALEKGFPWQRILNHALPRRIAAIRNEISHGGIGRAALVIIDGGLEPGAAFPHLGKQVIRFFENGGYAGHLQAAVHGVGVVDFF